MDNKKLDSLRDNINSLDDKILDLLKQRAEIVTEIGEQKKSKTDIVDIQREQKVLDRLLQNSKTRYPQDSIVRIWREIFQASTKLQENNSQLITTKRSINSINIYKGGKSSVVGKDSIIKLSCFCFLSSVLVNGRTKVLPIEQNDCFEIDTVDDLKLATSLLKI